MVGLLLLLLRSMLSLLVGCEDVRVCHDRCCPGNLLTGSASKFLCLVVPERGRGGV